MATQQTSSEQGRSIGGNRRGFLRLALKLDAIATGAVGVLLLLAAATVVGDGRPFVRLLGMSISLLVSVGLFLVVFAAFVWVVGSRRRVGRPAAREVIAINAVYAVGCVVVVAAGWFSLTAFGVAFVLVQAAAVALFAALKFLGLRRSRPDRG